jgi:hypothetical protein
MPKGLLNPRQLAFVEAYTSPASPTFSKVKDSAELAGYKTSSLVRQPWFVDFMKKGTVTPHEVIAGIKKETTTTKATDRLKAWELLGKHLKLFTDRVENDTKVEINLVNYSKSEPIEVKINEKDIPAAQFHTQGVSDSIV